MLHLREQHGVESGHFDDGEHLIPLPVWAKTAEAERRAAVAATKILPIKYAIIRLPS